MRNLSDGLETLPIDSTHEYSMPTKFENDPTTLKWYTVVKTCFLNPFPSISIDFGRLEAEFLLGFKMGPILA